MFKILFGMALMSLFIAVPMLALGTLIAAGLYSVYAVARGIFA